MTTTAQLIESGTEELARELDRIREEVLAARGENDAPYIRRVIAVQRRLEGTWSLPGGVGGP